MAEETKKVEAQTTPVVEEPKKDVSDEKVKAPAPEKCADDNKAIVLSESNPHLASFSFL